MPKIITGEAGWTLPLAGFANPKYLAEDPNDSTGFDVSEFASYTFFFAGGPTATIVHEQTMDPSGLTGWFAVHGRAANSSGATTTMQSTNVGYEIPVKGYKARMRVTALTVADINVRILGQVTSMDMSSSTVNAGTAAHDSAIAGNPIRIAGRAVNANYTPVANSDTADVITTLVGAQIQKPYSIPEADWQINGTKTDLTDLVRAAGPAGSKNYMTGLQYHNKSAVASDIVVKRGGTTIWTGHAPASMTLPASIQFATPLQTSAAEAMNIAMLTTGTNTLINAQGYQAP